MSDKLDAGPYWGNSNLPGPDEWRLNLIDGVEYVMVRADDIRTAMRERDELRVALKIAQDAYAAENDEVEQLRAALQEIVDHPAPSRVATVARDALVRHKE